MKRLIAYVSLFALLLSVAAAFIGCGETGDGTETTHSTVTAETDVESETVEVDHRFDNVDYDGREFRIYVNSNTDACISIAPTNFFEGAGVTTGDKVNDAVVERNMQVEELIDVTLVHTYCNLGFMETMTDVRTYTASGTDEVDLVMGYLLPFGTLVVEGHFCNVQDEGVFDFDRPYWYKECMEDLRLVDDYQYLLAGDYFINVLRQVHISMLNKNLYYESPRPERGCHAQIGYNGYSLWTFPFWGIYPHDMEMDRHGILESGSGVPLLIAEGDRNVVFTSLWDNYPDRVEIPVGKAGRMAFVAVSGSTNPNLCGIENARLIFRYADGTEEILPLVNPRNYIQLTPYPERAPTKGYEERRDVFNKYDEDLLKDFTPEVLWLGEKLRTLVIRWPMKANAVLESVTIETTSPDVVAGVMAITVAG